MAVASILFITIQAAGASPGGLLIDPGHSPKSPGATSCTGKAEYLYNDALAKYLSIYLSNRQIPVTVTRKEEEECSLRNRADSASGKALILSIHHDSVQPQFITWKHKRPYSTKARGYSIFVSSKNRHYAQSLKYARRLGAMLRSKGLKSSTHHGEKIAGENRKLLDPELGIYLFDDLVVLKNSDAPAILFEAAVIVHPDDEALASSEKFQRQVADAIAHLAQ